MPRGDQRRSTVHAAVTQFRPCNKHVNPVNSDKPKQKVKQTTTANQWHTVTIWFTLSLKNVINGYSWIFILTCFIPYHVAKHSDSADDDVRHFQWRKFFCWSQASYLKGKKGDISFQECLGIPVYSTKSLNDPISVDALMNWLYLNIKFKIDQENNVCIARLCTMLWSSWCATVSNLI